MRNEWQNTIYINVYKTYIYSYVQLNKILVQRIHILSTQQYLEVQPLSIVVDY